MTLSDILAAIKKNDTDTLSKTDFDVNMTTEQGNPLLYVAAQYDALNIIKYLIEKGANVNATNAQGFTALHVAGMEKRLKVGILLIKKGADCSSNHNKKAFTPLHIAAKQGHSDIVDLLILRGADISQATIEGDTPLMLAAKRGHIKSVRSLIHTLSITQPLNTQTARALFSAIWYGHTEVAQLLFAFQKNPIREMEYHGEQFNFLGIASIRGHLSIAQWLLDQDIFEVNSRNGNNCTALHLAVKNGYHDLVQLLLERGADTEIKTRDENRTALFYASDSNIINLLLDHGADISARLCIKERSDGLQPSDQGNTCLHEAVWEGDLECARVLIQRGADLHAKNKNDETPLIWAIHLYGLTEIFFLLLEAGASIRDVSVSDINEVVICMLRAVQDYALLKNTVARCLLVGWETRHQGILRYLNRPKNNIEATMLALLSPINMKFDIALARENIPDVLYFIFSVHKRFTNDVIRLAQDGIEYFQVDPKTLSKAQDQTLQKTNVLWWLRAVWMNRKTVPLPSELVNLIMRHLPHLIHDWDAIADCFAQLSTLNARIIAALCIELSDPVSPLSQLPETAFTHDWEAGPWRAKEKKWGTTHLPLRP